MSHADSLLAIIAERERVEAAPRVREARARVTRATIARREARRALDAALAGVTYEAGRQAVPVEVRPLMGAYNEAQREDEWARRDLDRAIVRERMEAR